MHKNFFKFSFIFLLLTYFFPLFCFSHERNSASTYYDPVNTIFTGYYLGVSLGDKLGAYTTSFTTANYTLTTSVPEQTFEFDSRKNSITGGGQIGYGLAYHHLLLGLELDWNSMNLGNTEEIPLDFTSPTFMPDDSFTTVSRWESSYRLRLGYVRKHWLYYATAGVSRINFEVKENLLPPSTSSSSVADSEKKTLTGGTVGIGTEYAINRYWSIGLEYRYARYPSKSYNLDSLIISDSPYVDTPVSAKVSNLSTNQLLFKTNFRVYA